MRRRTRANLIFQVTEISYFVFLLFNYQLPILRSEFDGFAESIFCMSTVLRFGYAFAFAEADTQRSFIGFLD
jgi:hypothetical protein